MDMPISERRQIENEMIFRRLNEATGDRINDLDAQHIEDNNPQLIWDDSTSLNFKCECSDEKCEERIPVKLSTYNKIHENRDTFIVKVNHQVNDIEKVILTEESYSVVKKNNSTDEPNGTLNKTSLNNSNG